MGYKPIKTYTKDKPCKEKQKQWGKLENQWAKQKVKQQRNQKIVHVKYVLKKQKKRCNVVSVILRVALTVLNKVFYFYNWTRHVQNANIVGILIFALIILRKNS